MLIIKKVLKELKTFSKEIGLVNMTPVILNESGNLIVHLSPYELVARIALYDANTVEVKEVIQREMDVANFIQAAGIPVISPNKLIPPGPYDLCGHWMTIWNYEKRDDTRKLDTVSALHFLKKLNKTMRLYPGDLPILGVWKRVEGSAKRLSDNKRVDIHELVEDYHMLNKIICDMESGALVASHGDAHINNLFPTEEGWLWTDFEDVSLMPEYWDIASFIANTVLFKGLNHDLLQSVLTNKQFIKDYKKFFLVLKARMLMSIVGNLDFALRDLGDLDYAEEQLKRYKDVFKTMDTYIINKEKEHKHE